ncbi:enoyl-CoA hydratase/isomerase family protein [Nocardioides sp. AE5]|uniref:enoyl-CoA hydratase/isomerase family protein n=1 Tax=Nocardioides sp. AE5 TaxID=2962573 RepID=UPI0028810E40|nr:enoyl-CoA hydratase/isomerase family protein [Nocardioides sp. AE5]MDT0202623.1 enoyl-CoA hydratase/isomerase family protein [Nocardioides sp. AE5]
MPESSEALRLVEVADGLAEIRIDRPRTRNAFDLAMWRTLAHIADRLAGRADLRCVVLRSAVPGAFCSGADLGQFASERGSWEATLAYEEVGKSALQALRGLPMVTMSTIDGDCFGGGVELALSCDLVLASEQSRFCLPPARLGLVYDEPGTAFLASRVPGPVLRWMLLTAQPVTAAQLGACQVIPDDGFGEFAQRTALSVSRLAPLALRGTKQMLDWTMAPTGSGSPEPDWLQLRREATESEDHREAVAAFAERRSPIFQGF